MKLLVSTLDLVRGGKPVDYSAVIDRQITSLLFTRVFYKLDPVVNFSWFDKDFLRLGYKKYEVR